MVGGGAWWSCAPDKSKLEGPPDAALELLFDEADHLPGTYPFLSAITRVLKPAYAAALQSYLDGANELADYASVRLVHTALVDEQEHHRLLTTALQSLPLEEDRGSVAEWEASLAEYLAAAGGLTGTRLGRASSTPRLAQIICHSPYPNP